MRGKEMQCSCLISLSMSRNLSPGERICAGPGENPLEMPHLWDPLAYSEAATQTLTGQKPPSDDVVCTDNRGLPGPTMADCFKMVMQGGGLHLTSVLTTA